MYIHICKFKPICIYMYIYMYNIYFCMHTYTYSATDCHLLSKTHRVSNHAPNKDRAP